MKEPAMPRPSAAAVLPRKTRDIHNHHMDSTIWDDFAFRDDDVVIATYAKSGTTWMQQIVGQLIFAGDPAVTVSELSPWMDLRVPPKPVKLAAVEAQTHRRFLKTHLPVDALVLSPKAKYVFVARDGRDVVWSLYNHHARANALWYEALNDSPGRVGPAIAPPVEDIRRYFLDWLDRDGHPFWPYWENIRGWWAIRDLPNVHVVHYADLKADLAGEIARIARFLGIAVDPADFAAIVAHCRFDWMKRHAAQAAPLGGVFWDGGAETFIHKGVNGRWRDVLTEADSARYEARARAELGADCAAWLAGGRSATALLAA
jgi:aryl sulfotransferase